MLKWQLKLLSILFTVHVSFALNKILPLTLIKSKTGEFFPPNYVGTVLTNINKDILKGTSFGSWAQGDLNYYCKDEDINTETDENRYCSYKKDFLSLDILECVNEPEPSVEVAKVNISDADDASDEPCGRVEKDAKMYIFGYKICDTRPRFYAFGARVVTNRDFFEVYRFCYSESQEEILYTEHKLTSLELLFNENLEREKHDYGLFSDGYRYFGSLFETMQNIFSKQNEPRRSLEKLVPSEDMAFALWRKPTFHMLNFKIISTDLKDIWNHINHLIREATRQEKTQHRIYTGAFQVSSSDTEKSTREQIYAYTPDIWVKIIRFYKNDLTMEDSKNAASLVIIMNNNLTDESFEMLSHQSCGYNFCENAFPLFPQQSKYIRCCMAKDNFSLKYFNLEAEFSNDSLLNLQPFVTKPKP